MKNIWVIPSALIVCFGILTATTNADLVTAVGDFQPRFKPGGNGPTDTTGVQSVSGVYTITYSGLLSDFGVTGNIDNARPFIGFDQGGAAVSDFVYFDNLSMSVDGNVIWAEDFSGATLGSTFNAGTNITGTVIQTANTLSAEVLTAPVQFTTGSGNAILLSTGTNNFSAIRPSSTLNPINFAAVDASATYSISFDIFIPEAVAVPEPGSIGLFAMGVIGAGFGQRRRRLLS